MRTAVLIAKGVVMSGMVAFVACGSGPREDAGNGATAGTGAYGGYGGTGAGGTGGLGGGAGQAGEGGNAATSGAGAGGEAGDAGLGGLGGAGMGGLGGAGGASGTGGAAGDAGLGGGGGYPAAKIDPGTSPWVVVPESEVRDVCKLDPDALAAAGTALNKPWAIVRYGRLCYEHYPLGNPTPAAEAWSTTKTLGAVVTGIVAYQTRMLENTGPKTGPLSDTDRVDHWIDSFSFNRDATIAHVLGMVAHNSNLSFGSKAMDYDTIGTTQINRLSDVLNAAITQDAGRLGANLEAFTQRFLFQPLGMTHSSWSNGSANKTFAFSWSTDVRDMARLGLLLMNGGMWNGNRVLDESYVYAMTHPSFEDANTGYGYLTWLNATNNHTFGGIPGPPLGKVNTPMSPGPCAPVAVWPSYPHGTLSGATDCNYGSSSACEKQFDVGVWNAVGLGGQLIQGHPGLDMVIISRDTDAIGSGTFGPRNTWDALRRAVINADPMYAGDESAFCQAYGSNTYAPDL